MCGVIAAKRLGADQIIIMGRHPDRIALARKFGGTDVISERGGDAVERVKELTGGYGAHSVLECVGTGDATFTRLGSPVPAVPSGVSASRHYDAIPAEQAFFNNMTVGGGSAPVRAYIEELLPDILEGRSEPERCSTRPSSSRSAGRLPMNGGTQGDQGPDRPR